MSKSTEIVLLEQPSQLEKLDKARQMLAESRTLSEVKGIRDIASCDATSTLPKKVAGKVISPLGSLGGQTPTTLLRVGMMLLPPVTKHCCRCDALMGVFLTTKQYEAGDELAIRQHVNRKRTCASCLAAKNIRRCECGAILAPRVRRCESCKAAQSSKEQQS